MVDESVILPIPPPPRPFVLFVVVHWIQYPSAPVPPPIYDFHSIEKFLSYLIDVDL